MRSLARTLTPRSRLRSNDDWLPAVLESHSLAIVNCNGDVGWDALRPYQALRGLFDDSHSQPAITRQNRSGVQLLASWLRSGVWPSGQHSTIFKPDVLTKLSTPEARASAAQDWLTSVAQHYSTKYLNESSGVGVSAVARARVDKTADLAVAPMFVELAPTAVMMLRELAEMVGWALDEAGPSDPYGAAGSDDILV